MARTQYQTTLQNTKPHDKHEPTDNEIVTNSSITLQPIHAQDTESAQPIPLDTLNQALTQLLNNGRTQKRNCKSHKNTKTTAGKKQCKAHGFRNQCLL